MISLLRTIHPECLVVVVVMCEYVASLIRLSLLIQQFDVYVMSIAYNKEALRPNGIEC